MRKVNIMVDVPDELYDNVVEPYKKARKFSSLINSLLTGYLRNDYIASYVDGTLDNIREESLKSLNEALQDMNNSLISAGVLENEASNMMRQGMEAVKVGSPNGTSIKEDDELEAVPKSEEKPLLTLVKNQKSVPEDTDLREEVNELKKQNSELSKNISMIMEMLRSANMSGNPTPLEEAAPAAPESKGIPDTKEVKEVLDESDPLFDDVVFGDEDSVSLFDEDDSEEDDDKDFLEGLLAGQVVSIA